MRNKGFVAALVAVLVMAACVSVGQCWVEDAKERMNDAYDWVLENLPNVGFNKETAQDAMDKAGDAASETSQYVSGKAGDIGSSTSDKFHETMKMATDTGNGKLNDMEEAYEGALKNVKKTYGAAKGSMSNQAKNAYETAKEKASDAAGNLGEAYGAVKDTVSDGAKTAYDTTKEKVSDVTGKMTEDKHEL